MVSVTKEQTNQVKCPCCYTDMLIVNYDILLAREIYKCPHCGYKLKTQSRQIFFITTAFTTNILNQHSDSCDVVLVDISRSDKENNNVIMTAREVAKFLNVSVASVRRWTRNGQLIGYRLGGRGDLRYMKNDVIKFPTSNESI